MSAQIKYAYLKGHTWLYRRNYPRDVAVALGSQALKQSLKTGDPATARVRAAEVNSRWETQVAQVRQVSEEALSDAQATAQQRPWEQDTTTALAHLRSTLEASGVAKQRDFSAVRKTPKTAIGASSRVYLRRRSNELRPGGYKSVRYSIGLFVSRYGDRSLCSLTRKDGQEFLGLIGQLSPVIGKSETTRGLGLDQLVRFSAQGSARITARTQKRIWAQVNHWLDWVVYEGQLEVNPFRSVRFEPRVRPKPYAVPTDEEVSTLLRTEDQVLRPVMLTCLLSGMRAGEAAGLLRRDLVHKGNLGTFVHVRPNELRLLKTDAAERLVPVHPLLEELFLGLPSRGPLFPDVSVNLVTKAFTKLRARQKLKRPGLVFHSTRKWFVTQCERTGVPEHWTASLVGHQSARSENGLTYGIYSAGISDAQKRGIVDQIRLPCVV
ncbi:hypothetical protein NBRC116601_18340 [Cognatishimia sp. WU-CL00825]|uniref:DUF6538 domain-containing protein n=1 Tax=Cognatishimia sp. WU-CL00825 TaxID=3127658 RepID=UPI0031074D92